MPSSCGQFLCAALLLSACCLTTALNVSETSEHWPLCMSTGVKALDNTSAHATWVVKTDELMKIELLDCPHGDKCIECIRDDDDMTFYAAHCATKAEELPGITCSKPGSEPCVDAEDDRCYPMLNNVRAMQECRFVRSVDEQIVEGGYNVRCKSNCSSAAFSYEDKNYKCKGCTSYCQNWLEKKRTSYPTGEFKFCENEGTECQLKSSDKASDEVNDSGRSSLSWAAAALIGSGFLSLGFSF